MSTTQKIRNVLVLVDFVPAELRENKTWKIVYYVKCPIDNKLKRKQNRVKPLKSITERRKLARKMVLELNKKLERGWNPLLNDNEIRGFVKFSDAARLFLDRTVKEVKNQDKRADTLRSYKSFIKNISDYLEEIKEQDMFVIKFKDELVRDFLDVVYYDRDNSARTRNNYLNFIKTFSDWLIRHKYISQNPTTRIELIPEKTKEREVIPDGTLKEIFKFLKEKKENYYMVCLICYYCLVRRTEITKLKVSDVILKNGVIYVNKNVAKNKKSMPVTIPDVLIPFLVNHLKNAEMGDYLFSDNYLPGRNKLPPKKISDEWVKVRTALNLPKKYQWYSLKDTGITNLLKAGVPPIAVRDQARHHSITQTEAYTPKEILKANVDIKTVKI
ncbi:tyrosine-type recombinase/integrase [Polaribacter ponticola]|uniref:Site-specific integrase n=1 Tax=Polaribacter ponticola TaxID=2978475 RepID=A0ABT5SCP8_9FLAO|nr:site-specific integrase [Polaribacter sp. MSW5]MDD7912909.1 site-specific integrase [Polaribacter sp. MSW5]MDD7915891.1 site-specific integrase [Polaribacter sp. MSW5]